MVGGMKAIHLICRRKSIGFEGLDRAPEGKNVWMSYSWAFPRDYDLKSLAGGWLYLHPDGKSALSGFGGIIEEIIDSARLGKPVEDGYMVVFEARKEARDKKWRGANHGMAWTGGIVEADYKHETNES